MELEERLGEKPLLSYFDWLAGTSTGAILALALADGMKLRDCLRLYLRLKDEVFNPPRPYSAEKIEFFLQQQFGKDRTMADIRGAQQNTACHSIKYIFYINRVIPKWITML